MNIKKSIAGSVAGVMLGGMTLVGCGSSHHHTEYDSVYDVHTHQYVVVTHDYYTHHRSQFSGTPHVVSSPPKTAKPTSTSSSKTKKLLCKIVKKHKKCKKS